MEVYIALDIGDKKIGIAKGDTQGILVSPIATIKSTDLFSKLDELKEIYSIKKLIVGLPKNMDGTEGEQALKVKKSVLEIEKKYHDIDVELEDERLTSEAAIEMLKDKGIKVDKSNKSLVDQYAAVIILEQYLARKH